MPHALLASRLLALLDLTSLGEDDNPAKIRGLCASACTAYGMPAAVCVYPEHVTSAREALAGTPIKIASVVNFPDGGNDPQRVYRETRRAVAAGADEIDMVLAWHALKAGESTLAKTGVDACRQACGTGITLKLILETGELASQDLIRGACEIGLEAGVDFLKTSTGKVPVNATLPAATLMLDAIAERGGKCGLKVAGGIRTVAEAQEYLALAEAKMGPEWATSSHFRIGASALFDAILAELRH